MGVPKLASLLQSIDLVVHVFPHMTNFLSWLRLKLKCSNDKILNAGIDHRYMGSRNSAGYPINEGFFGLFNLYCSLFGGNVNLIDVDDNPQQPPERERILNERRKKRDSNKRRTEQLSSSPEDTFVKKINSEYKRDQSVNSKKSESDNSKKESFQKKTSENNDSVSGSLLSPKEGAFNPFFSENNGQVSSPLIGPKQGDADTPLFKEMKNVSILENSKNDSKDNSFQIFDSMVNKTFQFNRAVKNSRVVSAEEKNKFITLINALKLAYIEAPAYSEADDILTFLAINGYTHFTYAGDMDLLVRGIPIVVNVIKGKVYVYELKHIIETLKFKNHEHFGIFCSLLGTDYIELYEEIGEKITPDRAKGIYLMVVNMGPKDLFDIDKISVFLQKLEEEIETKSKHNICIQLKINSTDLDLLIDALKLFKKIIIERDKLIAKQNLENLAPPKEIKEKFKYDEKTGELLTIRESVMRHTKYMMTTDKRTILDKNVLEEKIKKSFEQIDIDEFLKLFNNLTVSKCNNKELDFLESHLKAFNDKRELYSKIKYLEKLEKKILTESKKQSKEKNSCKKRVKSLPKLSKLYNNITHI